jgi:hypothetical protein
LTGEDLTGFENLSLDDLVHLFYYKIHDFGDRKPENN